MTAALRGGDWIGRKLLILGDVNTGKTTLARGMLADLCRQGLGPQIAIADFAPHIPEALARARGLAGIGGDLRPPANHNVLRVADRLDAPRLSSKSEAEAGEKARRNRVVIEAIFGRLAAEPRPILFLNDVTMYLQAGTAAALIAQVSGFPTVVANGYRGERLGGGELTLRESAQTAALALWFEAVGAVIELPGLPQTGRNT